MCAFAAAAALSAPPALAAEPISEPPSLDSLDTLSDVLPSLGAPTALSQNDLVASIGFTLALVLLVVLTGGVAYLTFLDWSDKQEAKKDAERTQRDEYAKQTQAAAKAAPPKVGAGDPLMSEAKRRGFGEQAVKRSAPETKESVK